MAGTTFTTEGGDWKVMDGPGGDSNVLFAVSANGGMTLTAKSGAVRINTSTGTTLLGVNGGNIILGTIVSATSIPAGGDNVWVCCTDSAGVGFYIRARTCVI